MARNGFAAVREQQQQLQAAQAPAQTAEANGAPQGNGVPSSNGKPLAQAGAS